MADSLLDDFRDVAAWLPVASGLARLDLSSDRGPDGDAPGAGRAMRLDFDFAGGGGFVVARRVLSLALPETWALCFSLRGSGPPNRLEIKLADPGGENVWWYKEEAFALPDDWRAMQIRSRDLEFAWGPAGGGAMTEVGAIEIALAAGPGGSGTLWVAGLRLEDRTVRAAPRVRTSSAQPGHAARHLFDATPATTWRSDPGPAPQWLEADFGREREYGGLVVDWEDGRRARAFRVQTSDDGAAWRTVHATTHADAARSWIYMPGTAARHLRIELDESAGGAGFGIRRIDVRPYELSRSIDTFFRGVAAGAPRGDYPRYLSGEQSYWTPVGVPDGETCALMNEEGLVEVDRGTFSLEPFLQADGADGALATWADAQITTELDDGCLPIPSSVWRVAGLVLRVTAFALRRDGRALLLVRYRVENPGDDARAVRLCVALRPFQVTPPWQSFGDLGGTSAVRVLEASTAGFRVDDARTVAVLGRADAAGAATFDQGGIAEHLRAGRVPSRAGVRDDFGYASGALAFDLDVAARGAQEVALAIPFGTIDAGDASRVAQALCGDANASALLDETRAQWRDVLRAPAIRVPQRWRHHADAMRTALAHVLVERDGPALQPGPRRYTRSWIRDGSIMAAALLRIGRTAEAQEFVRWYAGYQAADGNVPCAVDRSGPDWLVEHDSHGQLAFAVAECFRFTGDRAFAAELWPAVQCATGYLTRLRATRLDAAHETPEKRAFRGLLPESASHEGYLAHPVHSYWDDFWAIRAFGDAAFLATALGDDARAAALLRERDAMRADVRASLETTIATRGIAFVPGSVEWADFDPTATSNAISLLGETPLLPEGPLRATFAQYLDGFRRRRDGAMPWKNYTAYEVRIVGALVHLGERAAANELADFLLADQRPATWRQWPEISWRDPRSPGHIGDVPHAWIAAEYALAFRAMLAYERVADEALVIAAGIPLDLLDDGEVAVDDFATYHGTLGFTVRLASASTVEVELRGDAAPPGGFVLRPPLPGALAAVEVDGAPLAASGADEAVVGGPPARVVFRCRDVARVTRPG